MIKTLKEKIVQRKKNLAWDELPQIFKDAIALTKNIDCRWIWIESLYIIQDDQNDFEEEAPNMSQVYSNSLLNIMSTFVSSSSESLFSGRKRPKDFMEANYWLLDSKELINERSRLCVQVAHSKGHSFVTRNDKRGALRMLPFSEERGYPKNASLHRDAFILAYRN